MSEAAATKERFPFKTALRVRWAEVDPQGIVFNGHYLTYFDVGITEYWRAIGLPYPDGLTEAGSDLFAVKSLINFHAPARFDELIEVAVRPARIGNTSLSFDLAVFRGEQRLVSGEMVYVNADPVTRTAKPVPDALRRALSPPDSTPTP